MKWLVDLRGEKSQACIAKEVGVSQQYYSLVESGKRTPSVPVAKKIAAILGFEWTRFFDYG